MVDEQKVLDKIDYVRAQCNEMYAQRRYLTPHIFNYMMDCFEEYIKEISVEQKTKETSEFPVISW